jgi:Holliday junction resolvase
MNAVQYLEAAKVEEIASQYQREGYEVLVAPVHDYGYDLIATRGNRRLAIQVKARSELRKGADEIRRLREQASRQGFDEFRLVVVNPPREVSVEIAGLDRELFDYLANNLPANLEQLSSGTRIENVVDVDIDSVEVTTEGIKVVGSGTVEVELAYGSDTGQEGYSWSTNFPLSFDIELNHNLYIQRVNDMDVDTSSFYK